MVRLSGILSGTFTAATGCPHSRDAITFVRMSDEFTEMETMKILAASALTIGLATSAMAQSADDNGANGGGSGKSVTVEPNTPASPNTVEPDTVDPGITNSTTGMPDGMNSNADENCPAGPQGAQPDANGTSPGTASPTVNDNHCGK
ncbi:MULTISPECIES: hypothetical protein [Mesorhizobium]